ncbi:hypothetical protein LIER_09104 [Lithospermum erythrorhizon]|uniref:Uncharacterized protein n=1 Tax=Lithospermum erythrorhizon TaxID=34254 RepID=A0AAV3PEL6_LITER
MVQEMSTPLEILNGGRDGWQSVISTLIQQEFGRVMEGNEASCSEQLQTQANLARFDHFAGSIVSKSIDAESSKILDIAKADKGVYVLNEDSTPSFKELL